jgi:hypothetical protein
MEEQEQHSRLAQFGFWVVFLFVAVVALVSLVMSIDSSVNVVEWSLILPDKILATKSLIALFFWPVACFAALFWMWNARQKP